MKRNVTVYLDVELIRIAKQKGINVSRVCEQALKKCLEREYERVYEEKQKIENELRRLRSQKQYFQEQIRLVEKRMRRLSEQLEQIKKEIEKKENKEQIKRVIRQINKVILEADYDYEVIYPLVKDQIEQLKELGMEEADEQWLKAQIERLKYIMG